MSNNIYKPRYKITFLAKSKVWPYKNSRLRRFFNIRGRKLIRGGLFKRYVMVFNNMKWAIARRGIRPFMYRQRATHRRYKDSLYVKQQLKAFYGKQKELNFVNFFKKYSQNITRRNNAFASVIERRADIVLFRLRFLPTIFACHQFVHHYGILINNRKEYSPHALLAPGDHITFEEPIWSIFFEYLWERAYWRAYGLYIWKTRQYRILKKKIWQLRKDKRLKAQNVLFFKKAFVILARSKTVIKSLCNSSAVVQKIIQNLLATADDAFKMQLNSLLFQIIYLQNLLCLYIFEFKKKVKNLYNQYWLFKRWKWQYYYNYFLNFISLIFVFYKTLYKIKLRIEIFALHFYKLLINILCTRKIPNQTMYSILCLKYMKHISEFRGFTLKRHFYKKNSFFTLETKIQLLSMLTKYEKLLVKEHILWTQKLIFFKRLFLRRRLKTFSLKPKVFYQKKLRKIVLRKSKIKMHFSLQRRKKMRHISIPRLKPIHWYVPSHLFFDYTTLSAVYLYYPMPNEIIYSFKCSLQNIFTFYRTLGH